MAYENPDMFNPDRFMKHPEVDHTSMYDYYQLMPFGAGRRMCPGYQLGDMLVHLMVANLLHSFDWGLPKGGECGELRHVGGHVIASVKEESTLLGC